MKYIINSTIETTNLPTTTINFTSNNENFTQISIDVSGNLMTGIINTLYYNDTSVYTQNTNDNLLGTWDNETYRTIEFHEEPTGDLLTWLNTNATRESD